MFAHRTTSIVSHFVELNNAIANSLDSTTPISYASAHAYDIMIDAMHENYASSTELKNKVDSTSSLLVHVECSENSISSVTISNINTVINNAINSAEIPASVHRFVMIAFDSVETVNRMEFKNIQYLVKVVFPHNTRVLMNSAQSTFSKCNQLSSVVNLGSISLANALDYRYMFYNCEVLVSADIFTNFYTSKAIGFSYMFYNCNLFYKSIISVFDTTESDTVSSMFYYKGKQTLIATGWYFSKNINSTNFTYLDQDIAIYAPLDTILSLCQKSRENNFHLYSVIATNSMNVLVYNQETLIPLYA